MSGTKRDTVIVPAGTSIIYPLPENSFGGAVVVKPGVGGTALLKYGCDDPAAPDADAQMRALLEKYDGTTALGTTDTLSVGTIIAAVQYLRLSAIGADATFYISLGR